MSYRIGTAAYVLNNLHIVLQALDEGQPVHAALGSVGWNGFQDAFGAIESVRDSSQADLTDDEYGELVDDSNFLECLKGAGVDNWQGYDDAVDMHNQMIDGEEV